MLGDKLEEAINSMKGRHEGKSASLILRVEPWSMSVFSFVVMLCVWCMKLQGVGITLTVVQPNSLWAGVAARRFLNGTILAADGSHRVTSIGHQGDG